MTTVAEAEVAHRFELGAGTTVPLSVGVEASVHATDRVTFDASIGVLPPPYVDLINAAVLAFDGYQATADLIAAGLDRAILARLGIGVRPFRFPLQVTAGYALATVGGGLGAASAIEAVTGEDVRAEGNEIPMQSTVHFLHVGAAWQFTLRPQLVLRISLEYPQAFASSSGIDAASRTPSGAARLERASAALDDYLGDVYASYVKVPAIGVSLRWRP